VFVPGFWTAPSRRQADFSGLRSLRFLTEDDYPPFHSRCRTERSLASTSISRAPFVRTENYLHDPGAPLRYIDRRAQ